MAKRRILKREIGYSFGDLFSDAQICYFLLPEADKEKAKTLASRISEQCDEFICRAHHVPGKNKAEVKKYYKKLYADWQTEIDSIAKEVNQLTDKLVKE